MKRQFQTLSAGLLAAALAAPSIAMAQEDAAWPERPVNFVVGSSADRTARALAQFMPEELGAPITVVNREGAGGQLAASYVLAQSADGYTIFATAISPYLANSIIHTDASYSIDDFAFVNGQWSDWDLIAVNKDRDIHSMAEMVQAIKDNPGKMSVSIVPSSAGQLTAYLLLEAAGLTDSDLNIVTYESGGAAVADGQVDFTILGGEGSEGIRDMITPLAVVREEPAPNWDAPPVNEALKEVGVEIPVVSGSIRGLATYAEFKEKYPKRWDKLVQAYKATHGEARVPEVPEGERHRRRLARPREDDRDRQAQLRRHQEIQGPDGQLRVRPEAPPH